MSRRALGALVRNGEEGVSCGLVIGLIVLASLAVVEERVEVRLFWRVPRVRLAYVEILLERENQNNHRRVRWSLSGALLLLGCNAMAYR